MDYFTKIRQLVGNEKIILSGATGAVVKNGKILLVRRHNLSQTWVSPAVYRNWGKRYVKRLTEK